MVPGLGDRFRFSTGIFDSIFRTPKSAAANSDGNGGVDQDRSGVVSPSPALGPEQSRPLVAAPPALITRTTPVDAAVPHQSLGEMIQTLVDDPGEFLDDITTDASSDIEPVRVYSTVPTPDTDDTDNAARPVLQRKRPHDDVDDYDYDDDDDDEIDILDPDFGCDIDPARPLKVPRTEHVSEPHVPETQTDDDSGWGLLAALSPSDSEIGDFSEWGIGVDQQSGQGETIVQAPSLARPAVLVPSFPVVDDSEVDDQFELATELVVQQTAAEATAAAWAEAFAALDAETEFDSLCSRGRIDRSSTEVDTVVETTAETVSTTVVSATDAVTLTETATEIATKSVVVSSTKNKTLFDTAVDTYRHRALVNTRQAVTAIQVDDPIHPPSVYRNDRVRSRHLDPDGHTWTERALIREFDLYERQRRRIVIGNGDDPDCPATQDGDDDFDVWLVRDYYVFGTEREHTASRGWSRRAHELEMLPLSVLQAKVGRTSLFLDGLVSVDGGKNWRYVSQLPFTVLSVDGYGSTDVPVVGTKNIFVQTPVGASRSRQIWLRLDGQPGRTYRRYHYAFLWIATLGKYVVEFVDDALSENRDVGLASFRSDFADWMERQYGHRPEYRRWRSCYGKSLGNDFRVAVVRHADFLWKEACGVVLDDAEASDADVAEVATAAIVARKSREEGVMPVHAISLWKDMLVLPGPIPIQPAVYTFTVVSAYVASCFSKSYFADLVGVVPCPDRISALRRTREVEAGFLSVPSNVSTPPTEAHLAARQVPVCVTEIERGDVVAIRPDVQSGWRHDSADPWFGYVQAVNGDELSVLWMYRPSETIVGDAPYLIENELFLSDHCNCQDEPLGVHEVLYRARVAILIPPYKQHGRSTGRAWAEAIMADKSRYFVRQAYLTGKHAFETADRRHLKCGCRRPKPALPEFVDELDSYEDEPCINQGDTVLIHTRRPIERLDPVVIDSVTEDGRFLVRRLVRAREVVSTPTEHLPNELVWTDELFSVAKSRIIRPCSVRFFPPGQVVPPPYSTGGSGDCWILTNRHIEDDKVGPLDRAPDELNQGFDSATPPSSGALPGLSLFTGGGGLDRGLEAAHAVRTRWAVEWDRHAIHTTRANAPVDTHTGETDTGFWLGSVDDFVGAALSGRSVRDPSGTELVPSPGDVHFLSSGSPCQGFSLMQKYKLSEASRRNSSRVASTATALWLFLPDYFVIENVPNMARMLGPANIFAQLVASAVGLGYQVRVFHVDGWTSGAPQSRCRMILSCAAPGLTPLAPPARTHSHPPNTSTSALGVVAASGVKFGVRDFGPTPFEYVTASTATSDLPAIGKGHLEVCLQHPDHVLPFPQPPMQIARLAQVPLFPRELALRDLYNANPDSIPEPVRSDIENRRVVVSKTGQVTDRAWKRIHPDKLFPTITTMCTPMDRFTGQIIHWHDARQLTIAEVRRAQGWSDEEVVLGLLATQWKTLGNGVPRQIGVALGVRLRHAVGRDERRGVRPRLGQVVTGGDGGAAVSAVSAAVSAAVSGPESVVATAATVEDPDVVVDQPAVLAEGRVTSDQWGHPDENLDGMC